MGRRSANRLSKSAFIFLGALCVVSIVSPTLGYLGRGVRLTWPLFAAFMLVVVVDHACRKDAVQSVLRERRGELAAFTMWTVVVLVNAALGRGYTGGAHVLFVTTSAMLVVLDVVCTAAGARALARLRHLTIGLIAVDLARSLPELIRNPSAPRLRMLYGDVLEQFHSSYLWGVGEYNLYTAAAIAAPAIIAIVMSTRGVRRAAWLMLAGAWCIAVLLSTFMGAAMLLVVGVILFAVTVRTRGGSWGRRVAVVVVLVIFGAVVWRLVSGSDAARYVVAKAERQTESVTLHGVKYGDQTGRSILWQISIETFVENPLVGVGPMSMRRNPGLGTLVGGHSSLFDVPAEYGLVGALPLLLFVYLRSKRLFVRVLPGADDSEALSAGRVSTLMYIACGVYNPVVVVDSINALWIVATTRRGALVPSDPAPPGVVAVSVASR